jgi:hypothetical protein
MHRLEGDESYKPIPIGEYVAEWILEFNYGLHNRYLVIVVDCDQGAVHGHYLLDLNVEYGLDDGG